MCFSDEPMEAGSLGNNLGNADLGGLSSHCRTWKYENHDPAPRGGVGENRVLGPSDVPGLGIEP